MIVYIPTGVRKLALRVRDINQCSTLVTWETIQLRLHWGQLDTCWEGGSPWVLNGCWPGHTTGRDIANPWRDSDMPSVVFDATGVDNDGRILFLLDDRIDQMRPGRYTGILQTTALRNVVFNPATLQIEERQEKILPEGYDFPTCSPDFPQPEPPKPPEPACVLSIFDIDLGPRCSDHVIDQVDMDFSLHTCVEE